MPGIFGIVGSAPEGAINLDAQVRQMAASM